MRNERFGVFFFFFLLFFLFIVARILVLSLFPDKRLLKSIEVGEVRGKILDRNGKELALSKEFFSFYIRPARLSEDKKKALFNELSRTGLFEADELKLFFTDKDFVWIKRKMRKEEAAPLKEWINELRKKKIIKSDELGILSEMGRFYPYRETSFLIGNVSIDNAGISGVEYTYDSILSGGTNIQLSIDIDISVISYQELGKAVEENRAEGGSVVIIDNRNMELLSLVSYPSYDPNAKILSSAQFYFPAVSYVFEPGSTMKMFSMAFAIENKIVTQTKPLFYCPGQILISGIPFSCIAAHGYVSPETIIQKSCNVGMVQVADRFRREDFYNFISDFGFGREPELKIYGAEKGILRDYRRWSVLSKYMISIGQEIGVTALQLAIAASIIARGGSYRKPILVKYPPVESATYEKEKVSENTSRVLIEMMKKVISEEGTALSAKIEGISIAGKTGTGQIAKPDGSGYYSDLYNAVFVGFFPAEKPRYTILVVIYKPRGEFHTGGAIAAPVFANIVRRMYISGNFLKQE
ncbi:MAG: peptidoglycan D,D-transpeptidase FtsI family protein [Brevinematia bacterium]